MENATDALKMAFAVFVFVIALSICFSLFSKIKATADTVLFYTDKTNYYNWEAGSLKNGRIVGVDTVISTLKNHTNEYEYVIVDNIEFNYNLNNKDKINHYIEDNIGSTNKYLENIYEINTNGKYRYAEDGTKITIKQGSTRTYVTYTKI